MNKIEEIINNYDILEFGGINQQYIKNQIVQAMSEFGKICFEAGREANYVAAEQYIEELLENNKLQYQTYEDFLKEIEDVHIVKNSILQIKDWIK